MSSLHADEAFLSHYHLDHDPFAARVPGFKFFAPQRKPVLGQLHHLARYSQLMLVVSGPEGSGKTLVRQALAASANKQTVLTVAVSARAASSREALVAQFAQGLGVTIVDLAGLQRELGQLSLSGREAYLLVDDAEALGDAALDMLMELAKGSLESKPHVFLFARPELLPRLEARGAQDSAFHVVDLQPYSEGETRDYLAQRLEGAGRDLSLFSDEQIADIHERSGGWPGSINQVARDELVSGMLSRRSAPSGLGKRRGLSLPTAALKLPKKHLIALAVVGVGVIAAWLMQGETSHQPAATGEVADATQAESGGKGGPNVEFAGSSQPLPLPLVGQSQPVIRSPLAQAAGDEEAGDVAEEGAPIPAPAPVAPSSGDSAPLPLPAQPEVASKPLPPPAAPSPSPAKTEPKAAQQAAAAASAPAPTPATPAPRAVSQAAGGDWYASQPAGNFTLQILGSRSETSARNFVREHGDQYHYFSKQHQGKPLYVVTYGSFASRSAAQQALAALPAAVRAGKPWPRSLADVRAEIVPAR